MGSSRALSKIESLDLSGRASDRFGLASPAVFRAASSSTTFFGGTFWAADSMRWEALENGVWTFDTGVGSSIVPPGGSGTLSSPTSAWVNPFKHPGLHATMEGWIGFDNTFTSAPYFRRLAVSDPRWGSAVCVGTPAGLEGSVSFWAGVFPDEANALCYGAGQGYGNAWKVCIEHPFNYTGGGLILAFSYRNETEEDFDYSAVYCDTSGAGDDVEVLSFTGSRSGLKYVGFDIGYSLPIVPKPIKIKFCVTSDGAWSDQDGLNPTTYGAFAVDDIRVWAGGIYHLADFETSDGGWTVSPPQEGLGGEWSNLFHLNSLPSPLTFCACALSDSVLAFPDANNQHGNYQDNLAASPWIDLAGSQINGYGKLIQANVYADLPLRNYVFGQFLAQWYPETCLRTGKLVTSPWMSTGFVYDFGGTPVCSTPGKPMQIDLSSFVPRGAEQLRIALGCISYCEFFSTCTQVSNTSPWFDNVSLGVYGTSEAPFIASDELGRAQDNFPSSGLISSHQWGRIDANNIQGAVRPENGTTMGDTLVALCTTDNSEVYIHFKATPGPGTNFANFSAWIGKHAISPIDPAFRRARMDTAEYGLSGPVKGRWMTAYHESDPNFSGSDRATDPLDISPTGGQWRLANDVVRDNLFTAGSRIDYFFTANSVGGGPSARDPETGSYEVEILPSSFDNSNQFNCTLYVDHYNRGAQPYIEAALGSILGFGSANYENTKWDRYDVNAASSQQASLGRPLQCDYGASVYQILMMCRNLLWDSGDLNAFTLTKEDADVLNPWLTLLQFDNRNLYLSGDGIVYSVIHEAQSEPSARRLIEDLAGVTMRTSCSSGTFSAANCPSAGAPVDMTDCVNLDPVSGAVVADHPARMVGHVAQGNGCPDRRSFDVLSLLTPEFGVSKGDEQYSSPVKRAAFASVTTDAAPGGTLHFRIIVDGVSVHYRRDAGTPCDFLIGGEIAVTERMREVSTYFSMTLETGCFDVAGAVDLPEQSFVSPSGLGNFAPNPYTPGVPGRLTFTLARTGKATLDIFDLQGRLVRKLFDGTGKAGENEVTWDGTDASSHPVAAGIYFYRLRAPDADTSKKIVITGRGN